ncbi:MAG: 50S ribosomal protein L24 [Candidatus Aenigmarchaeota archaeon]|nr:50S ribosomal protein L24 [Candidatus Aenigmarchaeota archaeon]
MKCTFCGAEIPRGRGKMFVKISGQVLYFCGSKCQKNYQLKRDGKKVKWTKKHAEFKKK